MMNKRNESEQWDQALDTFHAQRGESGQSDRWLKANHPESVDERRAFYDKTPWHRFRAMLDQKVERHRVRRRLSLNGWLSGLGVAVSAAVAVFLMMPSSQSVVENTQELTDVVRVKGGATADSPPSNIALQAPELIVLADGERAQVGATISANAVLTFRINSFAYDHVIVFGVEEDGTISPYYPDRASGYSVLVGQGRGIPLQDGVRLDGRLGREGFVAIFSKEPLSWRTVQEATEQAWKTGALRVDSMKALGLNDTAEAMIWFDKQR